MNYKVMQRPMFKLGGKAASQGTGITSGLDDKVNYSIGGGVIKGQDIGDREGFKDPNMANMSLEELLNMEQQNRSKQMSGLDDMRDIVRLNALSQLVGNVLPNIERGGLKGITDFFRDPGTTQAALSGLTGLKKVDLQEKKLAGSSLDKYISRRMDFEKIDIARNKANRELDREIRLRLGNEAQQLLDSVGGDRDKLSPSQFSEFERKMKIALGSGFNTESEAKAEAYSIASRIFDIDSIGIKKFNEEVEKIASSLYFSNFNKRENDAQGGRVGRQMGSPMMGEQPLPQDPTEPVNPFKPKPIGPFPSKTEGQGNNVYAMLRSRLPQEVPDEVVQLISYNKEAFADFASIKNQEDVSSFNEKYGVELVIDVATV